jgi:hypothetical protein
MVDLFGVVIMQTRRRGSACPSGGQETAKVKDNKNTVESERRLIIDEIIEIIRRSYSFVLADGDGGSRYVGKRALALKKQGRDEEAEKLLDLMPYATEVIATDDRKSDVAFLKIFLVPGEAPVVQFFTEEHRQHSQFLLDRLCQALEVEIAVIEPKLGT